MALTRAQKTRQIDNLLEGIDKSKSIVFTEYRGINMKDNQSLRVKLRESGIDYKVLKTTLFKIALKKSKIDVPQEILDKPLAAAIGYNDEVAPAKILSAEAKEIESLKVLGGLIGKSYFDANAIKQLAMLPGREELYGKLAGTIAAPMSGLVGVLNGNLRGLVSVLSQYQAKKSE